MVELLTVADETGELLDGLAFVGGGQIPDGDQLELAEALRGVLTLLGLQRVADLKDVLPIRELVKAVLLLQRRQVTALAFCPGFFIVWSRLSNFYFRIIDTSATDNYCASSNLGF